MLRFATAFLAILGTFAAFAPASPAPQAGGQWQKIQGTPTTQYHYRAVVQNGVLNTVKLPVTPPNGATINLSVWNATINGERVTWANNSGSGYTPGPHDTTRVTNYLTLNLTQSGGVVGGTTAAIVNADARYFDMGTTYANGSGATDTVYQSGSAVSGVITHTANGSPYSVRVSPNASVAAPTGITASSVGTYNVDILASW